MKYVLNFIIKHKEVLSDDMFFTVASTVIVTIGMLIVFVQLF